MTAVAATTGPDILSVEFDADPYPFYAGMTLLLLHCRAPGAAQALMAEAARLTVLVYTAPAAEEHVPPFALVKPVKPV